MNAASNRRLATKILVEKKTVMNKEAIGTLTGKYFHSVKSDRETIEMQGKFLGLASPGLYRVQIYEWVTGSEYEQLLVPATDMRYWRVYDTPEQWIQAYENYSRRIEARERAAEAAKKADTQGGR